MDIHIAIIGTHNVGKHSMIHRFVDGCPKKEKKDTYYTSITTHEDALNSRHPLGYKKRLDLILNVYCIEYQAKKKEEKKAKINKCILTPSSCRSRRSTADDIEYNADYDDLMCDGFDFNEWHEKKLNIGDITRKNDTFMLVVSMDDKQSFVQCLDILKSVKKPMLIVVTKWDLPDSKRELSECDIAEFAVDIGCPYVLIAPDTFGLPFNRVISSIRGYCAPGTWRKISDVQQHTGGVTCMRQSLDGKYLLTGGADGSIRVWDIETSICIAIIAYHSAAIHSISEHCITMARQWWKPCRYLITCCADGWCCVWMIFDYYSAHHVVNNDNIPLFVNSPRFVFKHNDTIRSFAICTKNILCTVGDDKRMKLWSLIDGKLLYHSSDCDVLNRVIFVSECNKIYAAARGECLFVWDIARPLRHTKLRGGHHGSVTQLMCCKEVYVISCDEMGYIRCRDARSPHKRYWDYAPHNDCINALCMNKNALYTASRDCTARGYAIPDGEILLAVSEGCCATVNGIDCNDQYIVSTSSDDYVRCYDEGHSLVWATQRHSLLCGVLCGKKQFKHMVFSCDEDGIILGWNMNEGECCACFGNDMSRKAMIRDPKRSAVIEWMIIALQFLQLTSLNMIALQFYRLQFYLSSSFEWIISIVSVVLILIMMKCRHQSLCWIAIRVAFIPILRAMFGAMWRSFWAWQIVSFVSLLVLIATACKMAYKMEYNHSHCASPRHRNKSMSIVEKSIVVAMCAISQLSSDLCVVLLISASACLCGAVLIEPRFYAHKANIVDCALFFGVLWTNVWSLFVMNQSQMEQLTQWSAQEITKFETVVHWTMLAPFMLFGALLMFIRTHKHFYDSIRGDFIANISTKCLIKDEDNQMGSGMVFPPPLVLSSVKAKASVSLVPLCEEEDEVVTVIHHDSSMSTNHAHVPMMGRVIDCDNLLDVPKHKPRLNNETSGESESSASHFDYYASIKDDHPPAAYARNSNRSDVTAFSGIADVPTNIGHHLFDQYP